MIEEMDRRGRTIPLFLLGDWWLRLARNVIASDPRDLRTLGADLAKHLKGKRAFDHSFLSRFGHGKAEPTLDLIDALCAEFTRLPRPMFFARTYEEAVHLQVTAERYGAKLSFPSSHDSPVTALPSRSRRKVPTQAAHANDGERPIPATRRRTRTA
jgi:hypothetical protein